jgi:hypothetical protein
MSAYAIYRHLSAAWQPETSRAMRWLAARYYANVDSVDVLRSMCERGCYGQRAPLTTSEVAYIIRMR